jgi:REP-associated tyrosine transposase
VTGDGAERGRRRSIRLRGYDYSQVGAYFVTICTEDRECVLGEVVAGEMRRNDAGAIALAVWSDLPRHYTHVQVDAFVAMPNHVHGIIVLTDDVDADVGVGAVGAGLKPARTEPAPTEPAPTEPAPTEPAPTERRHGLPEVVRAFKTFSARGINELRGTPGVRVWQRNYYEHIIRSAASLEQIRTYIETNPERWLLDRENLQRSGLDRLESWIYSSPTGKGTKSLTSIDKRRQST